MCNKTKDVTCVKVCLIFTQKGIANFYLTVIRWNSQNGKRLCALLCVETPTLLYFNTSIEVSFGSRSNRRIMKEDMVKGETKKDGK